LDVLYWITGKFCGLITLAPILGKEFCCKCSLGQLRKNLCCARQEPGTGNFIATAVK
jgi:hypothetical protein